MGIRRTVVVVIALLVIIFIVQNTQVVDVRILFWKVSMSRALVLLGTFGVGLLSGWMLSSFGKISN